MKTTIKKKTWKAIYRLLDRVSPVDYDCGTLCGAICCSCAETTESSDSEEAEMGIYLLPGEDKIHNKKDSWLTWTAERAEDYEFPLSWKGKVYFVRCKTPPHCPRHLRPMQCRTYPLTPYITPEGILTLIWNQEDLPYQCPLVQNRMELDPRFVKATYTVWSHLIRDPLIFDLIEMDSRLRQPDEEDIVIPSFYS